MPLYNFNPWSGADHNGKKYLGQPGLCGVFLGTEAEDPKYSGPCGPQYSSYRDCLIRKQFDRDACQQTLQTLSVCQKTKLSDMSVQIEIFQNWRKNKGVPLKPSFTPIKIFDQGPQCIDFNKS